MKKKCGRKERKSFPHFKEKKKEGVRAPIKGFFNLFFWSFWILSLIFCGGEV